MIWVEGGDFGKSECCWDEVKDGTAHKTANSKSDEAGEKAGIEAARHKGENSNSNDASEAD